jgi:hypothetical protein
LALVCFTALAWRWRFWSLPGRVHYSLVTVAALALAAWFEHWNILQWWFT